MLQSTSLEEFIKQSEIVKSNIVSDISSVKGMIKELDEGSKPQDISQYTGELVQKHLASNNKVYENAVQAFLAYCADQGLRLNFDEFDKLDKNLGIRKKLKLEENEKMLNELHLEINSLKEKHLLRNVMLETRSIALDLDKKIEDLMKMLERGNLAKGSRAQRQYNALSNCRTELGQYVNQGATAKRLDRVELIKKTDNLNKIIKKMELDFEKIGYPGKLRTFIDAAKNKCTKLLNYLGFKGKTTKSLEKTHVEELTVFTSAFDAFKKKVKSETTALSPESSRPDHPRQ